MFSYQVDEELHKLLSLYDEAESLMRLLDVASSKYGAIDLVVKQITAEPDKVAQSRDNLNNHLVLLRKEFGAISPRLIYSSIEALKGGFETLEILNKSVAEISLSSELDSFTISYENYLQQYSTETAITLINSAQKLKERLFWFRQGALSFGVWGKIPDYEYSNSRALSIVLSSEMDMLDFIEKLNSISNIYIEICHLLSVSTTEYPIRILKIESGSLLASILGHSEVVNLLTKFIGSAATYIYGNYTDNGKLNSIPRKVETIDSVLKLRDNLKNSGIAIDDMDENISKAAVAVAKDLNALISGEAKIKLNDRVISVGEEVQKKMIENKETLTLSHERNAEPPADAVGLPRLPGNTGPEKL